MLISTFIGMVVISMAVGALVHVVDLCFLVASRSDLQEAFKEGVLFLLIVTLWIGRGYLVGPPLVALLGLPT